MITGFASGCPSDAHEEMLLGFIPSYEVGNSMRGFLPIRPAVGCGNQYWVFGADETIQKIVWIVEGSFQIITVLLDPTRSMHSVFAEPNGQWSTVSGTNIFEPTFAMTSVNGKSVNGYFNASSEFIDTYGDSGQLTGWSLSGLSRYATLRPDGLKKTEAECDVTLGYSGGYTNLTISGFVGGAITTGINTLITTSTPHGFGIAPATFVLSTTFTDPALTGFTGLYSITGIVSTTSFYMTIPGSNGITKSGSLGTVSLPDKLVTISLNGITLCSGSGAAAITLSQSGTSGVSGSVNVVYGAGVTTGAYVTKRYAASYSVSIDTLSTTIADNGLSEILSFTLGTLSAGSYTLSITPVSDTGITGTATTQSVTIAGAPNPPGVPIYVSGTIAATVISFVASTTVGATYKVYMPQEVGGPTFIESAATTHIAGAGTISVTCPALAAAAGDVTFFVTSVNGGYESAYKKLTVTYLASGAVATPAPNVPGLSFQTTPVSSGRNINVIYLYDKTGQLVAPTMIQTQIKKYETGAITTQSAVAIGSFNGNTIQTTLTIASGSDGWFLIQARTQSGAGANSDWSPWLGPVWCSNVVVSAITGLTTNIVG